MGRSYGYAAWAIGRFARRVTAYIIILPVITVLFPITVAGNALGRLFYRLKQR